MTYQVIYIIGILVTLIHFLYDVSKGDSKARHIPVWFVILIGIIAAATWPLSYPLAWALNSSNDEDDSFRY